MGLGDQIAQAPASRSSAREQARGRDRGAAPGRRGVRRHGAPGGLCGRRGHVRNAGGPSAIREHERPSEAILEIPRTRHAPFGCDARSRDRPGPVRIRHRAGARGAPFRQAMDSTGHRRLRARPLAHPRLALVVRLTPDGSATASDRAGFPREPRLVATRDPARCRARGRRRRGGGSRRAPCRGRPVGSRRPTSRAARALPPLDDRRSRAEPAARGSQPVRPPRSERPPRRASVRTTSRHTLVPSRTERWCGGTGAPRRSRGKDAARRRARVPCAGRARHQSLREAAACPAAPQDPAPRARTVTRSVRPLRAEPVGVATDAPPGSRTSDDPATRGDRVTWAVGACTPAPGAAASPTTAGQRTRPGGETAPRRDRVGYARRTGRVPDLVVAWDIQAQLCAALDWPSPWRSTSRASSRSCPSSKVRRMPLSTRSR